MKNKVYIILCIAAVIVFLIVNNYLLTRSNDKNRAFKFNGVVEAIRYDVKDIPYVTIGGLTYYLSYSWNFEHLIEKGDSLQKKEGEMIVKLIKKDRRIYIFKD
jgi:hypothetical protein